MDAEDEKKILCLIRFGAKEHIENFVKKGEMRFSLLTSHRASKDKERGDHLEGAISVLNDEFTKIEADHPVLGKCTLHAVPGKLWRLTHFDDRHIGCFSSYTLTPSHFGDSDNAAIDERMLEFGDYAVMIPVQHLREFFSRVQSVLDALNISYHYSSVTYQDFNARGEIKSDAFTKRLEFSHQSEHRIIVELKEPEPLFIHIGSLEDIAFVATAQSWIETKFTVTKRQPIA